MGHEWGPVDDCIRCIHCEALVGTPGPCRSRLSDTEIEALHDAWNGAW